MEIDPSTYPSRAFIRFTAQNQLLADLTGNSITTIVKRSGGENYAQDITPTDDTASDVSLEASPDAEIDEALFEEIAKTIFSASRYPELYQSCGTRKSASRVEAKVASEIVAIYKQIKHKQNCALVQRLNALL